MKKFFALVIALVVVMSFATTAFALENTVTVNFKSYLDTQHRYKPVGSALSFVATASLFETKDATYPISDTGKAQTFKVTALSSGGMYGSFGKAIVWSSKSASISALSSSTYYMLQFGNTEEQYYIKGQVAITHSGRK